MVQKGKLSSFLSSLTIMVPYRKHRSSSSTGEPTSATFTGTSPSPKSLRNSVKFDTVVVNQEKGLNRQKSLLLIVVDNDKTNEKFMNIFLCILGN